MYGRGSEGESVQSKSVCRSVVTAPGLHGNLQKRPVFVYRSREIRLSKENGLKRMLCKNEGVPYSHWEKCVLFCHSQKCACLEKHAYFCAWKTSIATRLTVHFYSMLQQAGRNI